MIEASRRIQLAYWRAAARHVPPTHRDYPETVQRVIELESSPNPQIDPIFSGVLSGIAVVVSALLTFWLLTRT